MRDGTRVRYGLIDVGAMGQGHIRVLRDMEEVKVAAMADPRSEGPTEALETLGKDVPIYEDYRAMLEREQLDAVIIATGATPFACDAEITADAPAVEAWQVLRGEVEIGNSVVIADWRCDWIGVGLAEKLALDGCNVRLAVCGTHAGQNLPMYIRDDWAGKLHRLGVEIALQGLSGGLSVFFALPHRRQGDGVLVSGS